MYHGPLAFQYLYGWSEEGSEDRDGKEESEIPGRWESVEIAWPFVCK